MSTHTHHGRTFTVTQSTANEWQWTTEDGLSGYIVRDGRGVFYADVEDGPAEYSATALAEAVEGIAARVRTVRATIPGRAIARQWMSSGAIGSVLAQFATTGAARLDHLTDDAGATELTNANASDDMEKLLTAGYGYQA